MTTVAWSGAKPGEEVLEEAPGRMLMKGPTTTDVTVVVEVVVEVVVLPVVTVVVAVVVVVSVCVEL
jgi:hypothetical protein